MTVNNTLNQTISKSKFRYVLFIAHLSWNLKWAFWSPVIRCLSVRPSVCKLFTFSSSPEPLGQLQPNLVQNISGWRGFKFVQMKGHVLYKGEIKINWQLLKKIFSRTTGPILTKLGKKHPWVKMIQFCSNEKPINSHEVNNVFFSSLNQRYNIIICVYWFELCSQVSDVAHGPLVICTTVVNDYHKWISKNIM